MRSISTEDLKIICKNHLFWLSDPWKGKRADLRGTNLRRANLSGADLRGADLRRANLLGADLRRADLRGADLREAYLHGAGLRGANLSGADLSGADLRRADLNGADLHGADLHGAIHDKATHWPSFQIPQTGTLDVWGKKNGVLIKMRVPAKARRTACLINRKCRAEYVKVLEGEAIVKNTYGTTVYKKGKIVKPHKYNDDFTIDCAPGIHFFLTKEEAEAW